MCEFEDYSLLFINLVRFFEENRDEIIFNEELHESREAKLQDIIEEMRSAKIVSWPSSPESKDVK